MKENPLAYIASFLLATFGDSPDMGILRDPETNKITVFTPSGNYRIDENDEFVKIEDKVTQ